MLIKYIFYFNLLIYEFKACLVKQFPYQRQIDLIRNNKSNINLNRPIIYDILQLLYNIYNYNITKNELLTLGYHIIRI